MDNIFNDIEFVTAKAETIERERGLVRRSAIWSVVGMWVTY